MKYGYQPTIAQHESMCDTYFPFTNYVLLGEQTEGLAFEKAHDCACFEWKCAQHYKGPNRDT